MTARGLEAARTPAPTLAPILLDGRQLSLPITSQVSSYFASIESDLSSAISPPQSTDALGIQDWYGLYLTGFCDGEYTSSGGLNTTACTGLP